MLFEGQTHTKNPCATDMNNQGNDQERKNKNKNKQMKEWKTNESDKQ